MGVPSFFRWLVKKYPKVISDCIEDQVMTVDGVQIPVDPSRPNPNGIEFDYLYLDMNGIIHPCSHPEGKKQPESEVEMISNVFRYIDHIFSIVRPRKGIYMAIDGVAPRAKMNQQRARRFRAAQESREKESEEEKLRREFEAKGRRAPASKGKSWDSNVITPGTPFMDRLSRSLHEYIKDRVANSPGWQKIKVIFSDAKTPGEGEHKIMDFIRTQRAQPSHDPNTSHCLYGMDADLIMLGLATHEPHFRIIREIIFDFTSDAQAKKCWICGSTGHWTSDCSGELQLEEIEVGESEKERPDFVPESVKFQFIHINILREYLAHDLRTDSLPFPWDLERMIDDWVFLCFFVGNDFLPHLPSLEIREGAIDMLVRIHRQKLPSLGGYLTQPDGELNLTRVDVLLSEIGRVENSIFRKRSSRNKVHSAREKVNADKKKRYQKKRRDALRLKTLHTKLTEQMKKNSNNDSEASTVLVKLDSSPVKHESNSTSSGSRPSSGQKRTHVQAASSNPVSSETGATKKLKVEPSRDGDGDVPMKPEHDAASSDPAPSSNPDKDPLSGVGVETEDPDSDVVDGMDEDPEDEEKDEDEVLSEHEYDSDVEPEKAFKVRLRKRMEDTAVGEQTDNVKLGEHGWKERYYRDKLGLSVTTPPPLEQYKRIHRKETFASMKIKAEEEDPKLFAHLETLTYEDIEVDEEALDREWEELDKKHRESHTQLDYLYRSYIQGLCWVMKYYYEGCVSWAWYYPFHYAPMASDLRNVDDYAEVIAEDWKHPGEPFSPFAQLMAVLPPDSAQALPECCAKLMTDPESPIADFYPTDFELDLNGKKYAWQAVVLLSFIDPEKLIRTLEPLIPSQLSPEELDRNSVGQDFLFVSPQHPLCPTIRGLYEETTPASGFDCNPVTLAIVPRGGATNRVAISPEDAEGMTGWVKQYLQPQWPMPQGKSFVASIRQTVSKLITLIGHVANVRTGGLEDPDLDPATSTVPYSVYELPKSLPHQSILLPGLELPAPTLTGEDIEQLKLSQRKRGARTKGRFGAAHESFQANRKRWDAQLDSADVAGAGLSSLDVAYHRPAWVGRDSGASRPSSHAAPWESGAAAPQPAARGYSHSAAPYPQDSRHPPPEPNQFHYPPPPPPPPGYPAEAHRHPLYAQRPSYQQQSAPNYPPPPPPGSGYQHHRHQRRQRSDYGPSNGYSAYNSRSSGLGGLGSLGGGPNYPPPPSSRRRSSGRSRHSGRR